MLNLRPRWLSKAVQFVYSGKPALTIDRAAELYMDPKTGRFVGGGEWAYDVGRYLRICSSILGDVLIVEIKHSHYRAIWRHLANAHVADPQLSGPRSVEQICGALRAMVGWLASEELIPVNVALPLPRWKQQMRMDWEAITGKPVPPPKKLRYNKTETYLLWAALPRAYPPLGIAVTIGAERRLGQVVRARRSDISKYVDGDGVEHEIGTIRIHGRGKKKGGLIVFNELERPVIIEAMTTGYLSELERAYKAGEISDYLLVPGKFFTKGKAQIKWAMRLRSQRSLRNYWFKLETLAGVEHVEGRGWYGLRRKASDDTEDVTSDGRVQLDVGGWSDHDTRKGYQEQGRLEIAERSAEVRKLIRPVINA